MMLRREEPIVSHVLPRDVHRVDFERASPLRKSKSPPRI
jgi:hypothetical protein